MRAPGTANCLLGKEWNCLTDVLVVLSALIINRWGTAPIYQSEEKLIDTGFDFIAVTCCLRTSPSLFSRFAPDGGSMQERVGKSTQTNVSLACFRTRNTERIPLGSEHRPALLAPKGTWSEYYEACRILLLYVLVWNTIHDVIRQWHFISNWTVALVTQQQNL